MEEHKSSQRMLGNRELSLEKMTTIADLSGYFTSFFHNANRVLEVLVFPFYLHRCDDSQPLQPLLKIHLQILQGFSRYKDKSSHNLIILLSIPVILKSTSH